MTLVVVIAAVAFVVVISLALMVSRSRQREEWEHFRQVADMTSAWSRESGTPYRAADVAPDVVGDGAADGADQSVDLRDRPARTTVDGG